MSSLTLTHILTLNLELNAKDGLSQIEFSQSRPGLISSLRKDANFIQLWDIQETKSYDYAINLASKKNYSLQEMDQVGFSVPVLWKSRKTQYSTKPLTSFSFIPAHLPPNVHHILAMSKDRNFECIKVQEACDISWEPQGGMIITGEKNLVEYTSSVPTKSVSFKNDVSDLGNM
jgi:hypothetical protein